MSFAALETRLNQAAKARLSNASATWWHGGMGVGQPVSGLRLIFDREASPDNADQTVIDAEPVASVLSEDVPGIARKCALRIARDTGDTTERTYTVLRAESDGCGWVKLALTEQAP